MLQMEAVLCVHGVNFLRNFPKEIPQKDSISQNEVNSANEFQWQDEILHLESTHVRI